MLSLEIFQFFSFFSRNDITEILLKVALNTNLAIFQLYNGEHKLIFNDFYSAGSVKQQSVDRHIGPL
jgi:hypothetical protein